jgi:hypothetical protein
MFTWIADAEFEIPSFDTRAQAEEWLKDWYLDLLDAEATSVELVQFDTDPASGVRVMQMSLLDG